MKKYFKALLVTLLLCVGIIGLTGCDKASKNSIVGTWEYKDSSAYVYTFNEDGTGEYSGMKFTYTTDGKKISITYENSNASFDSTYEIKDNQLIIKDSLNNDTIYIRK
ncbi:MAG: hypothetical protein IKF71_03370 [Bacilli bacterium]|nr:hypothetical protein [Bacilli bacterium]